MRRLTRRAFLSTTGMALGAALAACAPATPAPQPTAKPASTSAPEATAVPQPTPAAEPVTIVYYSWGDEQKWASEKRCFEPFLQANPHIKIDFQGIPGQTYWQKILAGIAAGDPPDVFRQESWKSQTYNARGVILCLDPYLEKDGLDPLKLFGKPEANTQCVYNGKWYGIPRGATGNHVVFYNRKLFDEAGIEWPEKTPRWTWNDLLSIAQALTRDTDGDGKPDVWGIDISQMANNWQGGQEFIWNWGQEEFSEDGKRCLINTPEAIEGLQFLADLRNKHAVAPYPTQLPEGMGDPFLVGKVAMTKNGGFMINVYKIIKDFDWGIAPVPAGPKRQLAYSKPNSTVITQQSKYPEASWLLLKHMFAAETVKCEALEGLWPPNTLEAMQEEWYLKRDTPPYDLSPTVPGLIVEARMPVINAWTPKIRQVTQAELDQVWQGKKTIREVAPSIEKQVNEILASEELPELS